MYVMFQVYAEFQVILCLKFKFHEKLYLYYYVYNLCTICSQYYGPWYFYINALLLFTKQLAYVFKNHFQEENLRSREGSWHANFSFVAPGPYDIVYGLNPSLCSDVMYVYNGPCYV